MAIEKKVPSPSNIKSSPQPFSAEEITEIRNLRTELNQSTYQFGQLHINKIKLEEAESFLKKQLIDLEKKESDVAKKLSSKYGKGSIDLETGTFTPSE